MRKQFIDHLCCPDCDSGVILTGSSCTGLADDIIDGSLCCSGCKAEFKIVKGIPVLLPPSASNSAELALRDSVSIETGKAIDDWNKVYDAHHFRRLAYRRLGEQLRDISYENKPAVLDIGIGWGAAYTPYADDIDLVGLDFSLESLLLLKAIYDKLGKRQPDLVCGSLTAIPIKGIKFDLIWSTQVYQHIQNKADVGRSFDQVVGGLLRSGGRFVMDNLNGNYYRALMRFKNIFSIEKKPFMPEIMTEKFFLKYYDRRDYDLLAERFKGRAVWKVAFTEALFHPELKIRPRSAFMAIMDDFVSKVMPSKYIARQISLILEKTG